MKNVRPNVMPSRVILKHLHQATPAQLKGWEGMAWTWKYAKIGKHHSPADVRPARPARWLADALLTGVMTSDSMPVKGREGVKE